MTGGQEQWGTGRGRNRPKQLFSQAFRQVGNPLFLNSISGFVHINLDTLHTRNKEAAILEQCLQNRASFVVDNTNPTADDRQRYIKAAREHGYRIEGYFFQSIVRDCVERNSHRSGKACIPGKAIACTSNRLELPSYEEGFDALYFVRIQDGAFAVDRWNEVSDTM